MAVVANTSPGDISHSDGHSIFKVQVLLQEQFSEKMRSFPYIQEVGEERKTGWISTLRDRKKEGYAMQVKLTIIGNVQTDNDWLCQNKLSLLCTKFVLVNYVFEMPAHSRGCMYSEKSPEKGCIEEKRLFF